MFEIELHDLIPYIFSISILYSFAYLYSAHVQAVVYKRWESARTETPPAATAAMPLSRPRPVQHWLTRRVKRKEAPDDDGSACMSSFVNESFNKRGGEICKRAMYSLGLKIDVSH